MDIEYDDSEKAIELAERVRSFIDEEVIPAERETLLGGGEITDETIDELRAEAFKRDLYCPQISEEYGGMGLEFSDVLPSFVEAGRSLLGPFAMRVDAPDEGNMHLIERLGTERQKEEWLRPLVKGEIKSAFSMTEPKQGGGSDPKMLKTTAEKDGDEWVINGHKWWSSQGDEAEVLLCLARTDSDAHPYAGCSFFLVPTDADGVEMPRNVAHMGDGFGFMEHPEVIYDDVRIPEENLLGVENEGFTHAQERLGPARLTHCMRFSGMAERALEVAKAYIDEREAFGSKLSEKQSLRHRVAEAEIELHAIRTMVRHAARQITQGEEARLEVAMSKVYAARRVNEILDEALQMCGGNGIARDLPISYFYENARPFRIVDGADEVHLRSVAREAFEDIDSSEVEHITTF